MFHTVCHPSTPLSLAPKLQALLSRLLTIGRDAPAFAYDEVTALLIDVGLKTERHDAEAGEDSATVDPDDVPAEEGFTEIDPAARKSVVLRWCGLVQTLLSAPEA